MINYFNRSKCYDCDCYVADYTNQSNNAKGVIISTEPFDDIAYFHLKKKNKNQNLPYLAVNLEEYPSFINGIENCECIFSSISENKKTWLLFLETKYCNENNIDNHAAKACSQMRATLSKLENLNLTDRASHNIYFVYSIPGFDKMAPFGSFLVNQDLGLHLKEEGIKMLGYNTVLIATSSHILTPYVEI